MCGEAQVRSDRNLYRQRYLCGGAPPASPTRLKVTQLELLREEIAMTVIVGIMTLLVGLIATTAAMELGALTHLGS